MLCSHIARSLNLLISPNHAKEVMFCNEAPGMCCPLSFFRWWQPSALLDRGLTNLLCEHHGRFRLCQLSFPLPENKTVLGDGVEIMLAYLLESLMQRPEVHRQQNSHISRWKQSLPHENETKYYPLAIASMKLSHCLLCLEASSSKIVPDAPQCHIG